MNTKLTRNQKGPHRHIYVVVDGKFAYQLYHLEGNLDTTKTSASGYSSKVPISWFEEIWTIAKDF